MLGKYDIGFVANFIKSTTVKEFEHRPKLVKVMHKCTVKCFWRTVYYFYLPQRQKN